MQPRPPAHPTNTRQIVKNLRTILLLFAANTISSIAQGMSMIAIPWYFVQIGQSQRFISIFLVITMTSLFWGPLSGTFVDKYNRKTILLALTTIVGTLIASIAAYGWYAGDLPWLLAALVFGLTFLNYNLHYPTLYAFLQEITEPRHYGRITSYVEIQGQLSTMLAGAGGAMLLQGFPDGRVEFFGQYIQLPFAIPQLSLHEIFTLDAATYFLAFFLILFMRYQPLVNRRQEQGTLIQRFQIGLTYLRSHPRILWFGIASYMVFATLLVSTFSLFALYVEAHLHAPANTYALGEMAYSIGALFAGIAIQRIFLHLKPVHAILLMTLFASACYLFLATTRLALIFYLASLLIGICNAGIRILRTTYLFQLVPNQVYGRIGSIFFVTNIGFRLLFLGLFMLPFFHRANHVIYAFVIFVVFLLAAAGVLWWNDNRSIATSET